MQEIELHSLLQCSCGGDIDVSGSAISCKKCGHLYEKKDGVIDLTTPEQRSKYEELYKSETLSNLISSFYDIISPIMCSTVWRCSPIRFIDQTHHVLGQSRQGVLLSLPVATGALIKLARAEYHDVQIIGVDTSLKMLKRAAKQFKNQKNILFIRAFPNELPFKKNVFKGVHSLNGLHSFDNRASVYKEFGRVMKPDATLQGTTIVHGQIKMADLVLEQYQNFGVSPPLRKIDFLMDEISKNGFNKPNFETHGAVAFFSTQSES